MLCTKIVYNCVEKYLRCFLTPCRIKPFFRLIKFLADSLYAIFLSVNILSKVLIIWLNRCSFLPNVVINVSLKVKSMISSATQELLGQFGLTIEANKVQITNFDEAGNCHIHHSRMPIVLTAYTIASPSFARERFPDTTFIDLVAKRPAMDRREVFAFMAICDDQFTLPLDRNTEQFAEHLWGVIVRYELDRLFEYLSKRDYRGIEPHYQIKPRGIYWLKRGQPDIPGGIKEWQKEYRESSLVSQLMAATIMTLYAGKEDNDWMTSVPKEWDAVEGIERLLKHGGFEDWARLYALYPGW